MIFGDFLFQEIELFLARLKPTFSNIRVDIKNLPHYLNPRELLTLIKPARLAAGASLLARSPSLQKKLARLIRIPRDSEEGQAETEREEGGGNEWTMIETRDLLNFRNGAGFDGSTDSCKAALGRISGDPETRDAAAGRSSEAVIAYVRQLESFFGPKDQGGLKFAERVLRSSSARARKGWIRPECVAEGAAGRVPTRGL